MKTKSTTPMTFTIIKSENLNHKFPISTTNNEKIFEYYNVQVSSMFKAAEVLTNNFILNYPLQSQSLPITARRTQEFLGEYFEKTTDYLILNFDNVRDADERKAVINQFASYQGVFFASRSCNDITNFNFRAIIRCDSFSRTDIKRAINYINTKLSRQGIQCQADVKAGRTLAISAPSVMLRIFKCEEIGQALTKKDIKDAQITRTIKQYRPEIAKAIEALLNEFGFSLSFGDEEHIEFTHNPSNTTGYVWYLNSPLMLWHWNPTKNVDLSTDFCQRYKLADYIVNKPLTDLLESSEDNNRVFEFRFCEKSLNLETLKENLHQWRDNGGVYCIKSAMGTGKTKIIQRTLSMFRNVLIVTPRVSLAVELSERLGIGLYSDRNLRNSNHLVCQYDSLFKLDVSKYQCVIFDEFMTLESHVVNTANNFTLNNTAKLQSLIANTPNVLISDALLEENIQDIFNDRDIFWNVNTFVDPTPLIIHKTFESFLKELSNTNQRRITVSCVSREKMHAIKDFLIGVGHKVCLISSENSPSERESILADFDELKFTALVYTPSISVGINITSDVDRHFHYDPGRIVTPVQSLQMMKRARIPEQIDCFIGSGIQPNVISIEEIRNEMTQSANPTAFCTFNKYGDISLSPAGKMYSWFILHDNIWRFNSKESFAHLAASNFKVQLDCQVLGADEFKGVSLKSYREKAESWTPEIREYLINTIGDYMTKVEKWIEPKDVKDFVIFSELRKGYLDPKTKSDALARASLRADFSFRRNLMIYDEKQELIVKNGQLSEKQARDLDAEQLRVFGLKKTRTLLGNKYEERADFKGLFHDIWGNLENKS